MLQPGSIISVDGSDSNEVAIASLRYAGRISADLRLSGGGRDAYMSATFDELPGAGWQDPGSSNALNVRK